MPTPTLLLALLVACGPSREEAAGLQRVLEKDPFPKSDLDFSDALTAPPEPPSEALACPVAVDADAQIAHDDVERWVATHPLEPGRRGPTRARWLPLRAGRVTLARTAGSAAAQGSASRAARAWRLQHLLDDPAVVDLDFDAQLDAALELHERALEPELVVLVVDATRLDAYVFDPSERRLVCAGTAAIPAETAASWVAPHPRGPPTLAAVEALTRIAIANLRALPTLVAVEAASGGFDAPATVATSEPSPRD